MINRVPTYQQSKEILNIYKSSEAACLVIYKFIILYRNFKTNMSKKLLSSCAGIVLIGMKMASLQNAQKANKPFFSTTTR